MGREISRPCCVVVDGTKMDGRPAAGLRQYTNGGLWGTAGRLGVEGDIGIRGHSADARLCRVSLGRAPWAPSNGANTYLGYMSEARKANAEGAATSNAFTVQEWIGGFTGKELQEDDRAIAPFRPKANDRWTLAHASVSSERPRERLRGMYQWAVECGGTSFGRGKVTIF